MTDPIPPAAPDDRALVLAAAPAARRPALSALFALDDTLARIVRSTREPLVGQMRLTWWHDALMRLNAAAAPAEPVLQAVQRELLPLGVTGASLAGMIDGWEELVVSDPLDEAALLRHAAARGAGLFTAAGRVLGADSPLLDPAGQGWALGDLSRHLTGSALADAAGRAANMQFDQAFAKRWSRALRPIAVLALLVRLNNAAGSPSTKALRTIRFRLIGR